MILINNYKQNDSRKQLQIKVIVTNYYKQK